MFRSVVNLDAKPAPGERCPESGRHSMYPHERDRCPRCGRSVMPSSEGRVPEHTVPRYLRTR